MTFVGGRYKNDVFISYAHGDQALTEWSFGVKTMLEQVLRFMFADRGRGMRWAGSTVWQCVRALVS